MAPQTRSASARDVSDDDGLSAGLTPTAKGKVKRLLVVGEAGDGKSTLINVLRDPAKSDEAAAGKKARGVTKEITEYVGKPIGGHEIVLLDTPGVGDSDVPVQKLFVLFEKHLADTKVDGVLVTTPVSDARFKLGAQVVKFLVEKGFVGGDEKWDNVVLVGTKNDKADDEDRECFRDQVIPELFASAPNKTGAYALVDKQDYSELLRSISQLPGGSIEYERPSDDVIQEQLLPLVAGDLDILKLAEEMREERDKAARATLALEQQAREYKERLEDERRKREQEEREYKTQLAAEERKREAADREFERKRDAAQREHERQLAAQREHERQLAAQREHERLAAQREHERQLAVQREQERQLAAQRAAAAEMELRAQLAQAQAALQSRGRSPTRYRDDSLEGLGLRPRDSRELWAPPRSPSPPYVHTPPRSPSPLYQYGSPPRSPSPDRDWLASYDRPPSSPKRASSPYLVSAHTTDYQGRGRPRNTDYDVWSDGSKTRPWQ